MKKVLFIIFTTLLISGCGFHFRGEQPLPPALKSIHVQSANPYDQFTSTLKRNLNATGIHVKNTPQAVNLRILAAHLSNTNPTIGASSQARVYTFTYIATFDLVDKKGKLLLAPQTVASSRNLTLNANQILGSNDQLTLLKQELERDIVNKIYNHLTAEQAIQAVSHLKP